MVLLTDGLANVGLGNLEDEPGAAQAFYQAVGTEAAAAGVAISVVAIDSAAEQVPSSSAPSTTKVGLEYLGGLADATGGTVELVSALDLASSALGSASAAEKTLASRASLTILVGKVGLPSSSSSQQRDEPVQRFTREIGRVTASSDLAFSYQVSARKQEGPLSSKVMPGTVVPIQVQFRYTLPNGESHLRVRTLRQPVTADRSIAEAAVDAEVCSVAAIQSAALLAGEGNYEAARVELMSHIRLLQRSMCTVSGQKAYLDFVVTAERLDQFMRQKKEEEDLLLRSEEKGVKAKQDADVLKNKPEEKADSTSRRSDRDDDSSSAIFQMKRLSLSAFRDARNMAT
jgi:hypothetical protein